MWWVIIIPADLLPFLFWWAVGGNSWDQPKVFWILVRYPLDHRGYLTMIYQLCEKKLQRWERPWRKWIDWPTVVLDGEVSQMPYAPARSDRKLGLVVYQLCRSLSVELDYGMVVYEGWSLFQGTILAFAWKETTRLEYRGSGTMDAGSQKLCLAVGSIRGLWREHCALPGFTQKYLMDESVPESIFFCFCLRVI
jgi:hypothetical protein